MTQQDRRMKTDRCARLCLIAILNGIDEAWISINPALLSLYSAQYSPTFFRRYVHLSLLNDDYSPTLIYIYLILFQCHGKIWSSL